MGPDTDYPELCDFDIVLESPFTDEQLLEIPYWTDVDHIAKINPADFRRYDLSLRCLDRPKLLPFSTINNGRRVFDIPRNRYNSHRRVTFSPKVDVKRISFNRRDDLIDEEEDEETDQAALWDGLQTEPGTHVIDLEDYLKRAQQPGGAGQNMEVLNENLEDLVPQDFDIIHPDLEQIFMASYTNGFDSDSVSCFSSSEED